MPWQPGDLHYDALHRWWGWKEEGIFWGIALGIPALLVGGCLWVF